MCRCTYKPNSVLPTLIGMYSHLSPIVVTNNLKRHKLDCQKLETRNWKDVPASSVQRPALQSTALHAGKSLAVSPLVFPPKLVPSFDGTILFFRTKSSLFASHALRRVGVTHYLSAQHFWLSNRSYLLRTISGSQKCWARVRTFLTPPEAGRDCPVQQGEHSTEMKREQPLLALFSNLLLSTLRISCPADIISPY